MSYIKNYQHIIFRTYHSEFTITETNKREMLGYIYRLSEEMKAKILRLNAYLNYVHIFVNLPSNISVSEYVKKIKGASSHAFYRHPNFPNFTGWARKFGSLSKSESDVETVINYIKGQEEHHRYKTFQEELLDFFGNSFFGDPQNRHDWLDEPFPPKQNPSAKADQEVAG